ncbi:hypothetical protein BH20ACT1_BH20ACT1_13360 [soil metagenome]
MESRRREPLRARPVDGATTQRQPNYQPSWQQQSSQHQQQDQQQPAWGQPSPQRQPSYQAPSSPGYGSPTPASRSSKADAAFVLGIVSLVFNLFFIPGILAIVWGGRERGDNSKARTGFICGIIGTALSALGTLFLIVFMAAAGSASTLP